MTLLASSVRASARNWPWLRNHDKIRWHAEGFVSVRKGTRRRPGPQRRRGSCGRSSLIQGLRRGGSRNSTSGNRRAMTCPSDVLSLRPSVIRPPVDGPGRRERLPAHAPLGTVRETFASHGSNLAKARPFRGDPWRGEARDTTGAPRRASARNWAILGYGRNHCRTLDDSAGTHQATGVARHLLFPIKRFHRLFSPCQTRPTWAYPAHYTPAFASSVISMLRLLPCLTVGAVTSA
jgi:hypothetical protein